MSDPRPAGDTPPATLPPPPALPPSPALDIDARIKRIEDALKLQLFFRENKAIAGFVALLLLAVLALAGVQVTKSLPDQIEQVGKQLKDVDGKIVAARERSADIDDRLLKTERRADRLDDSVAKASEVVARAEKAAAEANVAAENTRALLGTATERGGKVWADCIAVAGQAEAAAASAKGALAALKLQMEQLGALTRAAKSSQATSREGARGEPFAFTVSGSGNGITLKPGTPAGDVPIISSSRGQFVVVPANATTEINISGSNNAVFIPSRLQAFVTVPGSGTGTRIEYY